MSATRKNGAKTKRIDRPFAPAVLRRAKRAVGQYKITIWNEDGEYWGRCVELDCLGDGATPDECFRSTSEAASVLAAYMIEQGQRLPLPERERAAAAS